MLKVQNVSKSFKSNDKELQILNNLSFSIDPKSSVSIVGPSGSGKTTLLGLCAGLDNVSSGEIILADTSIGKLSQDELAVFRNETLGFVFQNFQLIPALTALENVMLPAEFLKANNIKSRAENWLERVGLAKRLDHYPSQLSGGEQQRVALARAFINTPKVLFADEPTGNLDEETSDTVLDLIFQLNKENNTTLIIVTHDIDLANKTDRILRLKGGFIESDTKK